MENKTLKQIIINYLKKIRQFLRVGLREKTLEQIEYENKENKNENKRAD